MPVLKTFLTLDEAIEFVDWVECNRSGIEALIWHDIISGRYIVCRAN